MKWTEGELMPQMTAPTMSETQMRTLAKLLRKYEADIMNEPQGAQPLYGEVIRLIIRQVEREVGD